MNDGISGDTVTDVHLFVGAESVDTAPGPVPVYRALKISPTSAHHEDDEVPAKSFSTAATVGARLSCNSHDQLNKDIGHVVEEELENLIVRQTVWTVGKPLHIDGDVDNLVGELQLWNVTRAPVVAHHRHVKDLRKPARHAQQGHRSPCPRTATGESLW